MNQFAQSTCYVFVYWDASNRKKKKHMSAHVLFTLVSHLRDGPARLHTQTVPLYSQTEAGSWTGAIPSANEVNQHKQGGGDCNYLSVFPQKTVFCFKDNKTHAWQLQTIESLPPSDAVSLAWLTRGALQPAALAATLPWTAGWRLER